MYPDVAVRVRLQAVRTRVRRRQRELLELLGGRIEAADRARPLRGVPRSSRRARPPDRAEYAGLLGVIQSSNFTSTLSVIGRSAPATSAASASDQGEQSEGFHAHNGLQMLGF